MNFVGGGPQQVGLARDPETFQIKVSQFYEHLVERRYIDAGRFCSVLVSSAPSVGAVEQEIASHCAKKFASAVLPVAAEALRAGDIDGGINLFAECAGCGHSKAVTEQLLKHLVGMLSASSADEVESLKSLHSIARLAGVSKIKGVAGGGGGGAVETVDMFPYVTAARAALGDGTYALDVAPCPGLSAREHKMIMDGVCQEVGKILAEIVGLFRSGKSLTQWEMYVSGNAEMPRRARNEDQDTVRKQIDSMLVECAILCGEINKFIFYAKDLLGIVCDAIKEQEQLVKLKNKDMVPPTQDMEVEIQEMLVSFLAVEQYCVVNNIQRAVQVSELDVHDERVQSSSLVDDFFFIAQASFDRSLHTLNEFGIYTTTTNIKSVMEDILMKELGRIAAGEIIIGRTRSSSSVEKSGALGNDADGQKGNDLDEQWSKAFETFFAEEGEDGGGAGPGGEKTSDSKGRRRADSQAQVSMFQMVVAVNSAHAAAEKTTKFTHYAKTKFLSIFPQSSKLEIFQDEMDRLNRQFQNLCDSGIEYIIERFMMVVKEVLRDPILDSRYVVTEEEHSNRSVSKDNFATKFIAMLNDQNGIIGRCRASMSNETFVSLLQCCTSQFSGLLVRNYKNKRFNELGALTLQAEVRTLLDGINSMLSSGSVRSQMAQLQVFVWLLNVDRPSDVKDESTPILKSSALAMVQVKEILRLRVEERFLREVENL